MRISIGACLESPPNETGEIQAHSPQHHTGSKEKKQRSRTLGPCFALSLGEPANRPGGTSLAQTKERARQNQAPMYDADAARLAAPVLRGLHHYSFIMVFSPVNQMLGA